MFNFEAAKEWNNQMDAYTIKMRRDKAKACLSSMKHYRNAGIKDEEQEKFDNMTEGLQQTERGQTCEQSANELDEAVNSIDCAIDNISNVVGA